MKKIILNLILLFVCLGFIPIVSAKKVTVYMFSKEGCPNCETAENYFNNILKENKDAFEYVIIEAYDANGKVENEDAKDLMVATLEEFEQEKELYFPTIVVGDKIHIGAGNLPDVYEYIKEYQEDDNYKDKIKELANKLDIKIDDIKRISAEEQAKKDGMTDALILTIIAIVIVGGFSFLIYLGKK